MSIARIPVNAVRQVRLFVVRLLACDLFGQGEISAGLRVQGKIRLRHVGWIEEFGECSGQVYSRRWAAGSEAHPLWKETRV